MKLMEEKRVKPLMIFYGSLKALGGTGYGDGYGTGSGSGSGSGYGYGSKDDWAKAGAEILEEI